MADSPWLSPGVPRPEIARRVRELVAQAELDDEEIGDLIGFSGRTVKRIRHALGELRGPRPSEVVSDAELRRLHAEGLDTRAISTRCGLTYRSTQERLSRLGLRANPARRGRPPGSEARDKSIGVRWTASEVAIVQAAAAEAELEVGEYVRRRVLGTT